MSITNHDGWVTERDYDALCRRFNALSAQRDELAAALRELHQRYNDRNGIPYALDCKVRAALARVVGGSNG